MTQKPERTPTTTPGSQALVNFKKNSLDLETFKKPSHELVVYKKKAKPKILTEEKYIEEIAKIIQRDFFPDLEKLKAQNEYLDAMERNDYARMESIRARYSGKQHSERSRSMTPLTFETPASMGNCTPRANSAADTPGACSVTSASSQKSSTSVADKHTLDSFLQRYTSEDNDSFQKIVDTADEKLRQKFSVLYSEERLSAEKLQRALVLPSIEQQFEQSDPMRSIETWNYKNKNSIMFTPEGVDLTEREKIEMANRKQVIEHSSTRLHVNPFKGDTKTKVNTNPSESQSQKGVNVEGTPTTNSFAPQANKFDLLKTPSPRPGEAFSPLMTWGEIEGTPFRLDGSDTPVHSTSGPSFKINESSRRESIALALAEKVGEKMRAQKQKARETARNNISSPFIRSNMERLASMSPAARRLANSTMGIKTTPNHPTPSPLRTPKTKEGLKTVISKITPSKRVAKTVVTPTSRQNRGKTPTTTVSAGTLTDDLLQIPTKRPRAADFF